MRHRTRVRYCSGQVLTETQINRINTGMKKDDKGIPVSPRECDLAIRGMQRRIKRFRRDNGNAPLWEDYDLLILEFLQRRTKRLEYALRLMQNTSIGAAQLRDMSARALGTVDDK